MLEYSFLILNFSLLVLHYLSVHLQIYAEFASAIIAGATVKN